jgi:hypothetical protein
MDGTAHEWVRPGNGECPVGHAFATGPTAESTTLVTGPSVVAPPPQRRRAGAYDGGARPARWGHSAIGSELPGAAEYYGAEGKPQTLAPRQPVRSLSSLRRNASGETDERREEQEAEQGYGRVYAWKRGRAPIP